MRAVHFQFQPCLKLWNFGQRFLSMLCLSFPFREQEITYFVDLFGARTGNYDYQKF